MYYATQNLPSHHSNTFSFIYKFNNNTRVLDAWHIIMKGTFCFFCHAESWKVCIKRTPRTVHRYLIVVPSLVPLMFHSTTAFLGRVMKMITVVSAISTKWYLYCLDKVDQPIDLYKAKSSFKNLQHSYRSTVMVAQLLCNRLHRANSVWYWVWRVVHLARQIGCIK